MELGALPQLVSLLDCSGARSSSAQRTAVLACNLLCLVAAEPVCKGAFLEGGMLQDLLVQLHASDASGEPATWLKRMHTGCVVECHNDRRLPRLLVQPVLQVLRGRTAEMLHGTV